MKNTIHCVSIDTHAQPRVTAWGNMFVHRTKESGITFLNRYRINSLTQYQRAVRLLNAFVERNMK